MITVTKNWQEVEKVSQSHMLCINGDVLDVVSTN